MTQSITSLSRQESGRGQRLCGIRLLRLGLHEVASVVPRSSGGGRGHRLGVTGCRPLDHAVAFGLIAYMGSLLLIRSGLVVSGLAVIAGSLEIVLFKPGLFVSSHVLTETLFILFTLLSLLYLGQFLSGNRWRYVILAAVFAGLASLTRYVGVTVIADGLLFILADLWLAQRGGEQNPIRRKAAQAATYMCIAAAPPALWLLRNLLVSDTLTDERKAPGQSVLENIQFSLEGLGIWVLPSHKQLQALAEKVSPVQTLMNSGEVYGAMVATVGACLLLLAVGAVILPISPGQWRRQTVIRNPLAPLALFTLLYLTFMIVTASVISYSPLSDYGARLLAPVYVPLVLMSVVTLEALWKGNGRRAGFGWPVGRSFVAGFCLAFVASVLVWNVLFAAHARFPGWGSPTNTGGSRGWRGSFRPIHCRVKSIATGAPSFGSSAMIRLGRYIPTG